MRHSRQESYDHAQGHSIGQEDSRGESLIISSESFKIAMLLYNNLKFLYANNPIYSYY